MFVVKISKAMLAVSRDCIPGLGRWGSRRGSHRLPLPEMSYR